MIYEAVPAPLLYLESFDIENIDDDVWDMSSFLAFVVVEDEEGLLKPIFEFIPLLVPYKYRRYKSTLMIVEVRQQSMGI